MSQIREALQPADYAAELIREVFRRHGHTRRLTPELLAEAATALGLEPPANRDVTTAVRRAVAEPVRWTDSNQAVAAALFEVFHARMPLAVAAEAHLPSILFVPVVLQRAR
jgi:hypothetical protein